MSNISCRLIILFIVLAIVAVPVVLFWPSRLPGEKVVTTPTVALNDDAIRYCGDLATTTEKLRDCLHFFQTCEITIR